jgi:hypothetical protein
MYFPTCMIAQMVPFLTSSDLDFLSDFHFILTKYENSGSTNAQFLAPLITQCSDILCHLYWGTLAYRMRTTPFQFDGGITLHRL